QGIRRDNTLFIHLTLVPFIAATAELKTKPTQHSVRELMEIGIQPDILVCRTERSLCQGVNGEMALFGQVDFGCVVESPDVKSIYEIPLKLHEQGLDKEVCHRLHLETKEPDLRAWAQMVEKVLNPPERVRIAVVGKYTELADSYKSIHEALVHGGIANHVGAQVDWLASDRFTDQETAGELLSPYDALLVPGGFGVRGVEGMLEAIRWAREHKLPFLGICLGLQTAIVEFARNVCKLPNTNSSEFEPECENPVIALMRSQEGIQEMGGTMRLGAYPCKLRPGSRVAQVYGAAEVSERHRHRYEVSNAYRHMLAAYGMRLPRHPPARPPSSACTSSTRRRTTKPIAPACGRREAPAWSRGCGHSSGCAGRPASPSSPTSTRRTTSRPPPRWPTCCRSRRSCAARRTSSSPQGRQDGR